MVDIVRRKCVKDYEVKARNGDHFQLMRGEIYTTAVDPNKDGKIFVATRYWMWVPPECFEAIGEP